MKFSYQDLNKPNVYVIRDKYNEVLYVGKSEKAIMRGLSHKIEGSATIEFIFTKAPDALESELILKYKPPGNKVLNTKGIITIGQLQEWLNTCVPAKYLVNKYYLNYGGKISKAHLKKILKWHNIELCVYGAHRFISLSEFEKLKRSV